MSMICMLRQVNGEFARILLAQPEKIFALVDDDLEEEDNAEGEILDLDKAWHGLHYLLTGTAWEGAEPLCYLVSGGQEIGDEEHDLGNGPARLLMPDQVVAFSQALNSLSTEEISRRFDPADMTKLDIYPSIWERQDENLDEWLFDEFGELRASMQRAADSKKAVVIFLT